MLKRRKQRHQSDLLLAVILLMVFVIGCTPPQESEHVSITQIRAVPTVSATVDNSVEAVKTRQVAPTATWSLPNEVVSKPGACSGNEPDVSQTITSTVTNEPWCLGGLSAPVSSYLWTGFGNFIFYQYLDKNTLIDHGCLGSPRCHGPRHQSTWFVLSSDGSSYERFELADSNGIERVSPDGTFIALGWCAPLGGRCQFKVFDRDTKIERCAYGRGPGINKAYMFDLNNSTPCRNLKMTDGNFWDIQQELDIEACQIILNQGGLEKITSTYDMTVVTRQFERRALCAELGLPLPTSTPRPTFAPQPIQTPRPRATPLPRCTPTPSAYPASSNVTSESPTPMAEEYPAHALNPPCESAIEPHSTTTELAYP